jgi:hypothetical protein
MTNVTSLFCIGFPQVTIWFNNLIPEVFIFLKGGS